MNHLSWMEVLGIVSQNYPRHIEEYCLDKKIRLFYLKAILLISTYCLYHWKSEKKNPTGNGRSDKYCRQNYQTESNNWSPNGKCIRSEPEGAQASGYKRILCQIQQLTDCLLFEEKKTLKTGLDYLWNRCRNSFC